MLFNDLADKLSAKLSGAAEPTLNVILIGLALLALIVVIKGNSVEKALLITWYVTP